MKNIFPLFLLIIFTSCNVHKKEAAILSDPELTAEAKEYESYRQTMIKKYGDTFDDPRYWYGYESMDMKFPYDDSLKRIEVLKHLDDNVK